MIEMSIQLKGVDKLMADNARFSRALPRVVLNAIRRPIRRAITVVKKRIRTECGIGVSIWGRKSSGLDKIVTLVKARKQGETLITGIKLKGLPALIEDGGQIRPHQMKNRRGSGTFMHPGSAVRAHGIARQEMDRVQSSVLGEVRNDITKLIGETFGKSA